MCKTAFAWLLVCGLLTGCQTKAGTGAAIGGGGGALIGGIIGNHNGHGAGGAVIGGAIGAITGGLIGHSMDKQDERERQAADERGNAYRGTYPAPAAARVSRDEIMDWSRRGVRDDIIIDRIDRSGAIFYLTGADENRLRDSGVSEDVIRAMKDTARRG